MRDHLHSVSGLLLVSLYKRAVILFPQHLPRFVHHNPAVMVIVDAYPEGRVNPFQLFGQELVIILQEGYDVTPCHPERVTNLPPCETSSEYRSTTPHFSSCRSMASSLKFLTTITS